MTNTTNNLTTIPLSQIKASNNNPRTVFDEAYIEGLSQSIKSDGVLQNLVVKSKGKKKYHEIISGECRYRALTKLLEQGDIEKDYPVPVSIKEGLEAEEAKRLAVVENLQRKDMHPMDEAIAVASLVHDGDKLEDISIKTGFSISLIKQRIKLTDLCDDAQSALRSGDITLSIAQALTLGTHDRQKELLDRNLSHWDAEDIKEHLTDEKPCLSSAIFPIEAYTGDITTDLFADENESYFEDRDQFFALQNEAVEALKEQKEREGFSPVEICNESYWGEYRYRSAKDDEKGGCVIHYHPCGDLTVHEGIVSRSLDAETVADIQEKKPKAFYSSGLCEYFAMHKSIAVQHALLGNPRKAKEVAVVMLTCDLGDFGKTDVRFHKCHQYFENGFQSPASEKIIEHVGALLVALGDDDFQKGDEIYRIGRAFRDLSKFYKAVCSLSDENLDQLHLLLTTLCFGQSFLWLDTDAESVFNQVALELEVDMRDYWHPDEAFLKRRNSEQLSRIVEETKTGKLFGRVTGYKKRDIVLMLSKHFKKLATQDISSDEDMLAKNWLPEAMSFPAIDPDKAIDDAVSEEEIDQVA